MTNGGFCQLPALSRNPMSDVALQSRQVACAKTQPS